MKTWHLVLDLKVNAWLRQCFPPETAWERLEYAWARATWPAMWRVTYAGERAFGCAWGIYADSPAQRAVRAVKRLLGLRSLSAEKASG